MQREGEIDWLNGHDCLGDAVSIICPQLGGEYTVNGVFESGPLWWRWAFS